MYNYFNDLASQLTLPSGASLVEELTALVASSDAAARCVDACEKKVFTHPDGRTDDLGTVIFSQEQLGLISHLAKNCNQKLSVEIGFGMGSTATMIHASRASTGAPYEHIIFDPWGLGDNDLGKVVESYLKETFDENYKRIWKRSEIGLGQLLDERGEGCAGFVFVDGAHSFEGVMIDFMLSDLLLAEGGYIVFDDAWFPAIETVVNFIRANRADYSVSHLPVWNTAVAKKISTKRPEWNSFKPFGVPNRCDWTLPFFGQ